MDSSQLLSDHDTPQGSGEPLGDRKTLSGSKTCRWTRSITYNKGERKRSESPGHGVGTGHVWRLFVPFHIRLGDSVICIIIAPPLGPSGLSRYDCKSDQSICIQLSPQNNDVYPFLWSRMARPTLRQQNLSLRPLTQISRYPQL